MTLGPSFRHKDLIDPEVISKGRKVRTLEGVRFFGKPIGTPITAGMVAEARKKHGSSKTESMLHSQRRSSVKGSRDSGGGGSHMGSVPRSQAKKTGSGRQAMPGPSTGERESPAARLRRRGEGQTHFATMRTSGPTGRPVNRRGQTPGGEFKGLQDHIDKQPDWQKESGYFDPADVRVTIKNVRARIMNGGDPSDDFAFLEDVKDTVSDSARKWIEELEHISEQYMDDEEGTMGWNSPEFKPGPQSRRGSFPRALERPSPTKRQRTLRAKRPRNNPRAGS